MTGEEDPYGRTPEEIAYEADLGREAEWILEQQRPVRTAFRNLFKAIDKAIRG